MVECKGPTSLISVDDAHAHRHRRAQVARFPAISLGCVIEKMPGETRCQSCRFDTRNCREGERERERRDWRRKRVMRGKEEERFVGRIRVSRQGRQAMSKVRGLVIVPDGWVFSH